LCVSGLANGETAIKRHEKYEDRLHRGVADALGAREAAPDQLPGELL